MSRLGIGTYLMATIALIAGAATTDAATLRIKCGGHDGLTTIGAALRALQGSENHGPSTINVSGNCNENVVIKDIDRLTIVGNDGASITDASSGTRDVIAVDNSRVAIKGFTIMGNANTDAIDCYDGSHCTLIGNTITGAYDGVGIYKTAAGAIVGGVLQNNAGNGLLVTGEAYADGVTVQGNPVGVNVLNGGRVSFNAADPVFDPLLADTPSVATGNGVGVNVGHGAQFTCDGCLVHDNAGDGIHADVSAAITIAPSFHYDGVVFQARVTNNSGHGVYVGDLASAVFNGLPTVSGNGQPDIACSSITAVTRRAIVVAGGAAHTNCSN